MYRPKITGEYSVGSYTFTIIDDGRKEICGPAAGKETRRVTARIFYPVDSKATVGAQKAILLSRAVCKGLQKEFFVKIDYDKKLAAGENAACYYESAPAVQGKKFPLMIFSHGFKSYKESNSYLCSEIASHGYVVISIGHTYASLGETHEDGSETYFDKNLQKKTIKPFIRANLAMIKLTKSKGTTEEIYEKFVDIQNKYCSFMLTVQEEWVKDSQLVVEYAKRHLANLIDFEPGIAASGHSLGGSTAYALCQNDPEFVCGINIDGGLFGNYENKIMSRPFFQICSVSNVGIEMKSTLNKTAPTYFAVFKATPHTGFIDIKFFLRATLLVGKIPGNILHENLCKAHLNFLDKYLKKKDVQISLENSEYIDFRLYE